MYPSESASGYIDKRCGWGLNMMFRRVVKTLVGTVTASETRSGLISPLPRDGFSFDVRSRDFESVYPGGTRRQDEVRVVQSTPSRNQATVGDPPKQSGSGLQEHANLTSFRFFPTTFQSVSTGYDSKTSNGPSTSNHSSLAVKDALLTTTSLYHRQHPFQVLAVPCPQER